MHPARSAGAVLSETAVGRAGSVAILAGSGNLPLLIADRLAAAGRDHRILAFRGFASRAVRARADAVVGLLDIKRAVACLEDWAPVSVTLVGGVRRPDASVLIGALSALWSRDEIAALLARGDDNLLRAVVRFLEEKGHRLVGVQELAPELLARSGRYGASEPSAEERSAIDVGLALLRGLSAFDIGQGAVVRGGVSWPSRARRGPTACWHGPDGLPGVGCGGAPDGAASWSRQRKRARTTGSISRP